MGLGRSVTTYGMSKDRLKVHLPRVQKSTDSHVVCTCVKISDPLLRPANEVWGKVIFLHLSVILFTGGVVSQHAPGSHYISSCTGADTWLVWRQHIGNIKCMMG